ncbi:MAG: CpaF family protein [Nitriliruptorales bacterium]|nr:CpaF family protein [Nitriliruptorales bacterium]
MATRKPARSRGLVAEDGGLEGLEEILEEVGAGELEPERPSEEPAPVEPAAPDEPAEEQPESPPRGRGLQARTAAAAQEPVRPSGRRQIGGRRRTEETRTVTEEEHRWADARRVAREVILAELAPKMAGPDRLEGTELEEEIMAVADRVLRRDDINIPASQRKTFIENFLSDTLGYGPLDELLTDPDVNEVMCNAYNDVWIERKGKLVQTDVKFADDASYRAVIERIVSAVGRRVDESSPMVDARLPDGSRVNAIIPPLALKGAVLTIRRFSEDPFTAQDLISFGTMSDDMAVLLEAAVRGKLNMLVSGGTGTGKTTLLNVLSRFIPEDERIVTVEDSAELQLQQPHVISLESRPANTEGRGEVTIRDLVRNTLRMRPDRIVIGECRGGEALDMLQAMNTGHEGSLTTIHANSARDALTRLEMLVLMAGFELPEKAIREQIASAIDVIIQIQRLPDGSRKVTSVQEIQGMEDRAVLLQEIYRYDPRTDDNGRYTGAAEPTGLRPKFLEQMKAHGITVPSEILRPRAAKPRVAKKS